jgi:hypothetical protein
VTTRGIALAVGLAVPAAWLLWAERLDAGWQPVLTSAGLWWLAAFQATWRVWLPAGVAAAALWLALPPRTPRRRGVRTPAPPAALDDGVAGGTAPSDWPDPARLSLTEWRVLSRTPEGAAVLAAAQEAARGVGARPPEPEPVAGDAGRSAPVPPPEAEDVAAEDAGDAPAPTPASREVPQDPTPAPPRVVVPGSVPAPPRTVWEAFAPLHQEDPDEDAGADAA